MKTADISLSECLLQIKKMGDTPYAFVDEIPSVLQDDFMEFIKGHTISSIDGRTVTYDIRAYRYKLISKGISYPVKWRF
jgi:RNase adaptor protein for sRNA GlmZ degradation